VARRKRKKTASESEAERRIAQAARDRELHLNSLHLETLPDSIANLSNLQVLSLDNNQLSSLPDSIAKLSNLRWLSLSNNQLSSLPDSIAKLSNLKRLDLSNNQLSSLPESILGMRDLTALFLHRNTALSIPAELLGPTSFDYIAQEKTATNPAKILGYYFRSRQGRPLNEAKLIFVGRGEVGKTSLVGRLVHNTFEPGLQKTEGIQITAWDIKLNGVENVRLNVWDFGGQEINHATHQFFLTQRSLYLLVLNGRQGAGAQ
jgi:internalin A